MLPFTQAQFLDIFRQYHAGVKFAQVFVLMTAVVGLSFAFWANRAASRVVTGCLAALWTYTALVYHWTYFSRINPAASFFAIIFLAQAAIWLWLGWRKDALQFRFRPNLNGWLGALVLVYSIAVYPAMNFVVGQYYPAAGTFGVPATLVTFSLGLLIWSNARLEALLIPLAWAVVGTYEAYQLGIPQDYSLAAAGLLALVLPRRIQ